MRCKSSAGESSNETGAEREGDVTESVEAPVEPGEGQDLMRKGGECGQATQESSDEEQPGGIGRRFMGQSCADDTNQKASNDINEQGRGDGWKNR